MPALYLRKKKVSEFQSPIWWGWGLETKDISEEVANPTMFQSPIWWGWGLEKIYEKSLKIRDAICFNPRFGGVGG
mgnify:CR=1 FL=1